MTRGENWRADLPSPIGRRPVLLLSRDRAYTVRNAVTVAFLTCSLSQAKLTDVEAAIRFALDLR